MARKTRIRFTREEKALRTYLQDCFNNPDSSVTIKQREKWRLELKAVDDAAAARAEEREEAPSEAPAHESQQESGPKPAPKVSDLSDRELRERFSKAKYFRALRLNPNMRSNLDEMNFHFTLPDLRDGVDSSDEEIAAIESEIRKRKMVLVWKVEAVPPANGQYDWKKPEQWAHYVDEAGNIVSDLRDTVYIGVILPNPPESNPPKDDESADQKSSYTPSSLQSAYWNRGKAKPADEKADRS